jgi:hypothetical protein
MGPHNDFRLDYKLEEFHVFSLGPVQDQLTWTRKIPTKVKNIHRAFWGFKLLPEDTP